MTIGSFATASTQLLPQAILELRRHRPELRVVVREGTVDTLLPGLFDGTIDLIAGRAPRSAEERLRFTELYSEPTVVVAGTDHPAARQPAELADLLAYPWVLPLPETDLRREIDDLLRRQGPHRIAEIVECSTIPVIRGILRGGQHLGVLPFLAARHAPDLVVLPTRLPAVSWSIGITTLCDRVPNPAAAAMLDAFTRVGAQLTEHLTEWTADYSGS